MAEKENGISCRKQLFKFLMINFDVCVCLIKPTVTVSTLTPVLIALQHLILANNKVKLNILMTIRASNILPGTLNLPLAAPPVFRTGITTWSFHANCSASWAAPGPPRSQHSSTEALNYNYNLPAGIILGSSTLIETSSLSYVIAV